MLLTNWLLNTPRSSRLPISPKSKLLLTMSTTNTPTTLVGSLIQPRTLLDSNLAHKDINQPSWIHQVHSCASLTHKGTNQPSKDGKCLKQPKHASKAHKGLSLKCNWHNHTQPCTLVHNQPLMALTRCKFAQSHSTMHPSAQSALKDSQCTLQSTNSN